VILFLVGLTLVALGVALALGRRAGARVATASARLEGELAGGDIRRLSAARCLGHDAPALGDVHGVGALGLTGTQLRFALAQPPRAVTIPLTQIVGATAERTFGSGRWARPRRRPVLVVEWVSAGGVRHRIGWDLPEGFTWSSTIAQLIGR